MNISPPSILESLIHNVNSKCSSLKGIAALLREASPGEKDELLSLMARHADILAQNIAHFGAEPGAAAAGYNGIVEQIYTAEHPEITAWTGRFEKRVEDMAIYSRFQAMSPKSSARAIVVGSLWHRFSAFMPWFLCQAAAMVSSNEKRHYVIQTAFEELGMRDAREIHPDMFWDAARAAGVPEAARVEVLADENAAEVLSRLRRTLLAYTSDEEVLGILLGLEIPARQNIETLFQSLAHTEELAALLTEHKFFRLHREIESEHVRLTVANFLRFCATEEQRTRFVRGFADGLEFWRGFWDSASALIAAQGSREVAYARPR